MKNLITGLILLMSSWSFAGGFIFPNVEFSYAKLHQFNIKTGQPQDVDYHIYKDGIYAASKLGNGILVSDEFHEELRGALARGVDELIMGLSKCYLPRHGIIYYDENHNPVASLSICFECDKINIWTKKGYKFSEDYEKFDYDKAEKQMSDMAELLRKEGIKVYDNYEDSKKYETDLVLDTLMLTYGSTLVEITDPSKMPLFSAPLYKDQVKSWLHHTAKGRFIERIDTLQNRLGQKQGISGLHYEKANHFLFSSTEEEATLIKGIIGSPKFMLPNGISVGMSLEQLARVVPFDNSEFKSPQRIIVHGQGFKVVYLLKHQTLTRIEIEIG